MTTTASTNALAQYAMSASATDITSSPFGLELQNFGVTNNKSLIVSEGIRGTRQMDYRRTRTGTSPISGPIAFYASPLVLDKMLPHILGGNESTDVFSPADTMQLFSLISNTGLHTRWWKNCVVSRATFSGSSGQPVLVSLDLECGEETTGAAFPAVSPPTDSIYVFSDSVFTFNSTEFGVSEWTLTVDNQVDAARFQNSLYRTQYPSAGQMVTLTVNTPWTDPEEAIYATAYGGAAGSIALTNADVSGTSCTIAFGNLQLTSTSPVFSGRGEIRLNATFQGFKTASEPHVKFTNTHTLD